MLFVFIKLPPVIFAQTNVCNTLIVFKGAAQMCVVTCIWMIGGALQFTLLKVAARNSSKHFHLQMCPDDMLR